MFKWLLGRRSRGTFHENWYSDKQIVNVCKLAQSVADLSGEMIEIGCWEGKSTVAIANAIYPEILHAVDHWQGNLGEGSDHISVEIIQRRDVYGVFRANVERETRGNVEIHKMDCFEFIDSFDRPLKFAHIDASHNYEDVKRTIAGLLPNMVPGGILCGDDFESAHRNREDLDGGVERAVAELLPGYDSKGNLWHWTKT